MNQTEALRRLRVAGIIAIATIAILAIAQALLIQWRYTSSPLWARITNHSGMRRSAAMDVLYRAERLASAPGETAELRSALHRLEVRQQALDDLPTGTGLMLYNAFVADTNAVLSRPLDARARQHLESQGPELIALYDGITASDAHGGDVQRGQFRTNALLETIALLTVLAVLYVFVMRPGESHIGRMLVERDRSEAALRRSRERFRSLFERSPNAIFAIATNGTIIAVNPQLEQLSGYSQEELLEQHYSILVPPDRRSLVAERIDRMMSGSPTKYEGVIRSKDGTDIVVESDTSPIRIGDDVEGVFVTSRDLTIDRALARRLHEKDERVRGLYILTSSSTEVGMLIDDALEFGVRALDLRYGYIVRIDGGVLSVQHRYGPDDLLPLGFQMPVTSTIGARLLASPRALAIEDLTVAPYADELGERGLPWKSYIGSRIIVDNVPYGVLVFIGDRVREMPFETADYDFIDLMSGLLATAAAREIDQQQLQSFAFHDVLTGLANRRVLEDRLQQAISYARRAENRLAVHYIDLNGFKAINDIHGHAVGDLVLTEVARRFTAVLREQDLLARIGGDEFVAIQTAIAGDDAVATLAGRLAAALETPLVLADGSSIRIAASFGSAIYPDAGTSFDLTIAAQTTALKASLASKAPAETLAIFEREQEALDADGLPEGIAPAGTIMPDGDLLDVSGAATTLASARAGKAAVVIFYRGAWCPYCNIALQTYQAQLAPALAEKGLTLIAISPQKPDGSLTMQQVNNLTFTVLSDPGNQIARQLGVLSPPRAEAAREAAASFGVDVAGGNGDGTDTVPMPTTVIVDAAGVIRWIDVHPNYSTRTETQQILSAIASTIGL